MQQLLAQLLALMANVNRDRTMRPAPFAPSDFLPDPFMPSPAQARQMGEANMRSFEAAYQASKKRPN